MSSVAGGKRRAGGSAGPLLSVVVPVFNEGANIEGFVARLSPVLEGLDLDWEVVCVNDGSADDTLARLEVARQREPRIVIVDFSRNFGKEAALSAGFAHARGAAVVTLDADLQHPPETIADMVAAWRGGAEIVYAVREARTGQRGWYKLSARIFYYLFHRLSEVPLPAQGGDYALFDRVVVDALNRLPERHRFLKGLYAWIGFHRAQVTYRQGERKDGPSRWRPLRLVRYGLDALTAFTTLPLRVWSLIGAAVSAVSFFYIVVRFVKVLFWGIEVPGYESLIVAVLFLGGVQLLSLGVLGTYLGRVFEEVKGRPLYVVRRVHGRDGEIRGGTSHE